MGRSTAVPNFTRCVRAATAASVVKASKSGTGKHAVANPDGVESQRFCVFCQIKDLTKVGNFLCHDDFPCWEEESKSGHAFVSLHVSESGYISRQGAKLAKLEKLLLNSLNR
jgi:hypothetical protein